MKTKDGYILTVFRIPQVDSQKPPIFMLHGVQSTSGIFVGLGKHSMGMCNLISFREISKCIKKDIFLLYVRVFINIFTEVVRFFINIFLKNVYGRNPINKHFPSSTAIYFVGSIYNLNGDTTNKMCHAISVSKLGRLERYIIFF